MSCDQSLNKTFFNCFKNISCNESCSKNARYRIILRGRTQIDPVTQNFQWTFWGGGVGKRTWRFQNFCFNEISSQNFLQVTLFYSFSFLYMMAFACSYSLRQVTDVKLGRVRWNSWWVGDLGGLTSQLTSSSFGRDVNLGFPCLDAACTAGLN